MMNTIEKLPATTKDVEIAVEKAVVMIADMIGMGFAHLDTRFDAVESRLGTIERLLLEEQQRKLESLETQVKRLDEVFAVQQTRSLSNQPCAAPPAAGGFSLYLGRHSVIRRIELLSRVVYAGLTRRPVLPGCRP